MSDRQGAATLGKRLHALARLDGGELWDSPHGRDKGECQSWADEVLGKKYAFVPLASLDPVDLKDALVDRIRESAALRAALTELVAAVADKATHWWQGKGHCAICDALATAQAVLR